MTDYWLVLFDLKENKQFTQYYETEFKKDNARYQIEHYKKRYLVLADSSDKYLD